jgi:hypothetical protein
VLRDVQRLLVEALRAPDPGAFLREQSADARWQLSAEEHAWLVSLGEAGLRITRLLVRKLRLQRLLRGDAAAAGLCDADPEAFARQFRAYDAEVPPASVFPAEEAAAFARWLAAGPDRA